MTEIMQSTGLSGSRRFRHSELINREEIFHGRIWFKRSLAEDKMFSAAGDEFAIEDNMSEGKLQLAWMKFEFPEVTECVVLVIGYVVKVTEYVLVTVSVESSVLVAGCSKSFGDSVFPCSFKFVRITRFLFDIENSLYLCTWHELRGQTE